MKTFHFCRRHPCKTVVAAVLSVSALASPSWAVPALLEDINAGGDSSPAPIVDLGGLAVFVADDGTNGVELWKSDGTAVGTQMILDLNPGGDSLPGDGTGLVVFNGAVYFDADDGTNGVELWKSDGTAVGTVMVKDINPAGDSFPSGMAVVGSSLYFAADDGTTGNEIWTSDGNGAGTSLVADINPGGDSNPVRISDVNGTAFFAASDGTSGIELWKSSGIGASLVLDINPLGNSLPNHLTNVAGTLFFAANDGVNGAELWKSDGTGVGTTMVLDIRAGGSSSPGNGGGLVNMGGTLYFDANDGVSGRELWKSDGTTAGTVIVKDINGGGGSNPGGISGLVLMNGTLFFDADDGSFGTELWKSDGSATGTVMVKDMEPGAGGSDPGPIVNAEGLLVINACDSVNGCELWWSDGTAVNTVLAADLQAGIGDGDPQSMTSVAGTLFFSADDGLTGVELYSAGVCAELDPLIPGCVPASADAAKCAGSLGKLTLKLLGADRKCAVKNSDAAVALGAYEGQSCEDVARYRFLGSVASMQLKAPDCVPACFGSGDPGFRATEIEASVDALHGAIYCDATSGTPQDDGFGGWVPSAATQTCSNAVTKLAGSLSKGLVTCGLKKAASEVKAVAFDLAACQAATIERFEVAAGNLTGCAACLRPEAIRDEILAQSNAADSAAVFCGSALY